MPAEHVTRLQDPHRRKLGTRSQSHRKRNSKFLAQGQAIPVAKSAKKNDRQINQPANAKQTGSEEVEETHADFACIKLVPAERAEKKPERQGDPSTAMGCLRNILHLSSRMHLSGRSFVVMIDCHGLWRGRGDRLGQFRTAVSTEAGVVDIICPTAWASHMRYLFQGQRAGGKPTQCNNAYIILYLSSWD